MKVLNTLWRRLTQTNALDKSSGQYETAFFADVYRVLYITGLSSSDRGFFYSVYSRTIKFMIVAFVASELWTLRHLFIVSSSMDGIIANINVTLIHLIAMYRFRNMNKHKHIYKKLAMSMESQYFDISTPQRADILEYWLKNNQRYFKLLLTLGTCTLAAWYVYPLVDDIEYNLVVTLRIPYNYATPNRYPITYGVVLLAFNYASYFVMVNDLIMQTHLIHLLCQYMVLGNCFENILDDCRQGFLDIKENELHLNESFKKIYIDRLRKLIEQHKFILSNTLELRRILSIPMLGQLAASSMLICFAAYQVTATVTAADITTILMSLLYLGYNMFELFIFCRWCDEIKMQIQYIQIRGRWRIGSSLPVPILYCTKPVRPMSSSFFEKMPENRSKTFLAFIISILSQNIREAVYFSGWERMAMIPGVRARLGMVVARASRPVVLTAGGVYDLSLASFATIVKTSYSALSVLLRARHD